MDDLILSAAYKTIILDFQKGLKDIYQEKFISLILYGSAVSGGFIDKYSTLNLLVVLENTDLENIVRSSKLLGKFKKINPLFLTEDYILRSLDVFPIEFLDMKENYFLAYGKDVLKNINIDMSNLRFQCEHELKQKLLKLKDLYLKLRSNPAAMRALLFASFTSVLHVSRNLLRIKGLSSSYSREIVIKELGKNFKVNESLWQEILSAKADQERLSPKKIEVLFLSFAKELEVVTNIFDTI